LRKVPVIVEDSQIQGEQSGFYVPPEKEVGAASKDKYDDKLRYRSVVAVPIFVGENDQVWGVLAFTTSSPYMFSPEGSNVLSTNNTRVARTLAKLIEFLATICENNSTNIEYHPCKGDARCSNSGQPD